jgi:hypothetical protein
MCLKAAAIKELRASFDCGRVEIGEVAAALRVCGERVQGASGQKTSREKVRAKIIARSKPAAVDE